MEYDTKRIHWEAPAALMKDTDDCDIFGNHIAIRLCMMSPQQRQIIEPLMYQLLSIGQMEQVTLYTHIAGFNSPTSQYINNWQMQTPS